MFSFVVEKKGSNDLAVTDTYMSIVKEACVQVGDAIEFVQKGMPASEKNSYIVTDTIQTGFQYMLKGYKNHIVWMQGVVPEESYMRNQSKLRFFLIGVMEKIVLKKAKLLLLVSDEMKTHYEKKYRLDLSNKSVIMPCFNETELVSDAFYQEKYDEATFAYVGGLSKWQCFEKTAELYAEIEKALNYKTKFFVYTFQKDKAERILSECGIKNYIVDCVEKEELSERIKTVKYGFVLREDCTVNNVATPTKFSNYLANGIIPIYSSALKSFYRFDSENRVGIVYDFDNSEQGLQNILDNSKKKISADEMYSKCKNAFETYYNEEKYIKDISNKILQIKE